MTSAKGPSAPAVQSEKRLVEAYLDEHELELVVNEVLNTTLRERPADPFTRITGLFRERARVGKGVTGALGRRVWDHDGKQGFEAEVATDEGPCRARVSAAVVASVFARTRALEDGFEATLRGPLCSLLAGKDPADLELADALAAGLDESESKAELGCVALMATSMAMCRAGAKLKDVPLFRHVAHVAGRSEFALPVPWFAGGVALPGALAGAEVGVLPVGAESFSEALLLARQGLDVLCAAVARGVEGGGDAAAPSSPSPSPSPLAALVQALKAAGLFESVRLSVTIPREEESDVPPDASPDVEEGEQAEPAVSKSAKEGQKAKGEPKPDTETKTADVSEAAQVDAEAVREAIFGVLRDEEAQGALAVVENIFPASDAAGMAAFVEEFGEAVVLFNAFEPAASAEPGAEAAQPGGAGEGKNAEAEAGSETKQDDVAEAKAKEDAEGKNAEDEEAKQERTAASADAGLSPCNGELVYVGVPFSDVCTVSDLVQVCESTVALGQCAAARWECGRGVDEDFAADFCVGAGLGLVRMAFMARANNVARLNQFIRLEQELGAECFYAGTRFRNPF